jgi:hypothetical protein
MRRKRKGQSRVLSLFPVYFYRLRQCGFDSAELGSGQVGAQILLTVLLTDPDVYEPRGASGLGRQRRAEPYL